MSDPDEFHLNIKKCVTVTHHKYSQHIHIAHFSQLQWISTLSQRPNVMLPTAHHLILFFNYINLETINKQQINLIRDEFIIQVTLSMITTNRKHSL